MLFYSVFKTLVLDDFDFRQVGSQVEVELKNDLVISGILLSVDQFLNIKLDQITVKDLDKYPQMAAVKNSFIRGSVVRYIVLPAHEMDAELLEDASRKEHNNPNK